MKIANHLLRDMERLLTSTINPAIESHVLLGKVDPSEVGNVVGNDSLFTSGAGGGSSGFAEEAYSTAEVEAMDG